ncbi:hypothetical protein [Streptomyces sp. NRRL F-2580]|uniref:hypothetical protein n=1 Tax=Streptomyces sp. NRRL F-2580 TaxID=1463841 RepID=UPI0004CBE485|nr:hypothetical protein [Streptomyces sp. NRRL F-2580]
MDTRHYVMVATSGLDHVGTGAQIDDWLRRWLKERPKQYDVDALAQGRNEIARGVTLSHESATGTSGAHGRRRLRETTPDGTCQTTVMIRQAGTGPTWSSWTRSTFPTTPTSFPYRPGPTGSREVCSTYSRRATGKDGQR